MPEPLDRRTFLRSTSAAALAVAGGKRLIASMPSARAIRIAQIGTEHAHAEAKWRTVLDLPDLFTPVGVFEPNENRRKEVAGDPGYDGALWISEDQLFSEGEVEAVLVETELPDLVEWTRRALAEGWHVHLDKPPGRNLVGLVGLQETARVKKMILQMGYMYRYHPAFVFCLDAVRKGWLGAVHAIHGDIGKVIGHERRPWLAAHYGGSMLVLGCHLLDLAVAILGEPDSVRSFSRTSYPDQDTFHDNETAVLEYPGAVATIRSLLFEVGGGDRRQFVVFGEKGTIEIRPLEPAAVRMVLAEAAGPYPAGEHEVSVPPVDGRYRTQLKDFAGMVRGDPSILKRFTHDHDRIVQQVLMQASGLEPKHP